MRINLVTLGCSRNTVDSEKLLKQLSLNGFEIIHNSDEYTDIVIINTCGFILDAKTESIHTILSYCDAKEKGFIDKILVIGCLSERYKNSLKDEIQEVDAFFGVNEQDKILQFLGAGSFNRFSHSRVITTPGHYAYLKISEGCNRSCTFCAIPMIRGRQVSVSIDDIVKEAKELEQHSVKELILIAQDLTSYGSDLYGRRMLIPLLRELCKMKGFQWIRLHYIYPDNYLFDELLSFITDERRICRYIDIPIQHINERILKLMKRGYGKEQIMDIIGRIRRDIPGVAIRTSLITGFPGETDEEFLELFEFIKEMRFDRLGVFNYSHEEGTAAGDIYEDNVPEKVKLSRMERLLQLQQTISLENNIQSLEQTVKVLIDGVEGEFYKGRTEHDSPEIDQEVLISGSNDQLITIGEYYKVKITDALEFDLFGSIVKKF
jgi:ribosomal protein S12 methylthiotransferase